MPGKGRGRGGGGRGSTAHYAKQTLRRGRQSAEIEDRRGWVPRGSQPPDVGVVAGTDQVVSFKTGGPTGDQTLIADGDYSDNRDGFNEAHNHYGSKQEGGGYIDEDRGHYTGPDH